MLFVLEFHALNHINLVYFVQTQFITNYNRLSTKQDQTHTQSIEIMLFILEFHAF